MINLILLVFTLAVLYAGFWLGAKYRTLDAMKASFFGWIAERWAALISWLAALAKKKEDSSK